MTDSNWESGVGGASLPPNRAWLNEHAGRDVKMTFEDRSDETPVQYIITVREVEMNTDNGD